MTHTASTFRRLTVTSNPAPRKGLELCAAFFGATSCGLAAGIVTSVGGAQTLAAIGAGGATFVATFGIGMKILEYLRVES